MSGTINVVRTDHSSFTVSDLDRSLRFFCDALGFEVISKAGRDPRIIEQVTGVPGAGCVIAYIRRADHTLELIEFVQPEDRTTVRPRPCDTGFAHICFIVDDVAASVGIARGYGVEPIGAPSAIIAGPHKDGLVVYLRDPDGITVEFIEPPKRGARSGSPG
jgi:catechol 2,3-dioxygenase-like lactoylglutathione lyase family enzyme